MQALSSAWCCLDLEVPYEYFLSMLLGLWSSIWIFLIHVNTFLLRWLVFLLVSFCPLLVIFCHGLKLREFCMFSTIFFSFVLFLLKIINFCSILIFFNLGSKFRFVLLCLKNKIAKIRLCDFNKYFLLSFANKVIYTYDEMKQT